MTYIMKIFWVFYQVGKADAFPGYSTIYQINRNAGMFRYTAINGIN